jgi:hypothetical protein
MRPSCGVTMSATNISIGTRTTNCALMEVLRKRVRDGPFNVVIVAKEQLTVLLVSRIRREAPWNE